MQALLLPFAVLAVVFMLSGLVSGLVQRAPLSVPMIFLGLGYALGGLGLLRVDLHSEALEIVGTISLAFADNASNGIDRALGRRLVRKCRVRFHDLTNGAIGSHIQTQHHAPPQTWNSSLRLLITSLNCLAAMACHESLHDRQGQGSRSARNRRIRHGFHRGIAGIDGDVEGDFGFAFARGRIRYPSQSIANARGHLGVGESGFAHDR